MGVRVAGTKPPDKRVGRLNLRERAHNIWFQSSPPGNISVSEVKWYLFITLLVWYDGHELDACKWPTTNPTSRLYRMVLDWNRVLFLPPVCTSYRESLLHIHIPLYLHILARILYGFLTAPCCTGSHGLQTCSHRNCRWSCQHPLRERGPRVPRKAIRYHRICGHEEGSFRWCR